MTCGVGVAYDMTGVEVALLKAICFGDLLSRIIKPKRAAIRLPTCLLSLIAKTGRHLWIVHDSSEPIIT